MADLRQRPLPGTDFGNVVNGAEEEPLGIHFFDSAQEEPLHSLVKVNGRKDRFDNAHAFAVGPSAMYGINLVLHQLAQPFFLFIVVLAFVDADAACQGRIISQALRPQRTRSALPGFSHKVVVHISLPNDVAAV